MDNKSPHRITILDLNTAAFCSLHGLDPELSMQGGRVVFSFPASEDFYKLSTLYNSNVEVPCLDLIQAIKKTRGKMLSLKEGDGNGNRRQSYERAHNR
jgi:hypothetical protein